MGERRVAEDTFVGEMFTQGFEEQGQVSVASLFNMEATVRVFERIGAFAYGDVIAEHSGVARIAHAFAHAFYVDAVLAIAHEGNRVVEFDTELLFQFTISRGGMWHECIEAPCLDHPAPSDGVDHAASNFGGIRQRGAADECHVLPRLRETPREQATCKACADNEIVCCLLNVDGCLSSVRDVSCLS